MKSKNILDEVNKYIIFELSKDGRTKLTTLAKKLNVTPAAVKERVERLIDKKILRVSALVNHQLLYPVTAVIGVEIDSDGLDKIIRRLRNCPLVFHINKTSGNHNLFIIMIAENLDFIDEYINKQIRSESGIKHVEVNIGNATILPQYTPLRLFYEKNLAEAPCGLMYDDERRCSHCPAFAEKEIEWSYDFQRDI